MIELTHQYGRYGWPWSGCKAFATGRELPGPTRASGLIHSFQIRLLLYYGVHQQSERLSTLGANVLGG